MQPRMNHPAFVVPNAMDALQALGKAVGNGGVAEQTLELAHLRASQINGCSVCLDGHSQDAKKAGETDERLFTLAAWREAPYFTDAERAALALTEAATRLTDGPVSDEVYEAAAAQFSADDLASLIWVIAVINAWNRLGATARPWPLTPLDA